jgi:hypothetical protein
MGWVLDNSSATGTARLVLISISNHIDSGTGEGWAYVKTICREANVSINSYHRAVATLIEIGELVRDENAGGSFRTRADARPNLFRLPMFSSTRPPQDGYPAEERGTQDGEGGGTQDGYPATSPGWVPIAVTDIAVKEPSVNPSSLALVEREDVERLCVHLADRIEANGSKRPTVTKQWRTAARLLIDNDARTEKQVRNMIDWCQTDEFWRSNILSMPTLRKQYDKMRLKATATTPARETKLNSAIAGFLAKG